MATTRTVKGARPVNGSITKADGTPIFRVVDGVGEILDEAAAVEFVTHMATVPLPSPVPVYVSAEAKRELAVGIKRCLSKMAAEKAA